MSSELTVVPTLPADLIRQATDIAGVCKEIVTQTAVQIQGRHYVKVEGWMSIATAHGCCASARDVQEVENGVRAIAEIRKVSDGSIICTAEGFVGKDEPTWYGGEVKTANGGIRTLAKRPDYAIRAMAQTRAISRACRTAFAHVVVLMEAGLSTTPAEEVPMGGFDDSSHEPARHDPPKPAASEASPPPTVPRDKNFRARLPKNYKWEDALIHFGKNKGMRLGELEANSLRWYADEWTPKPFNGAISAADQLLRDSLDLYLAEGNQS